MITLDFSRINADIAKKEAELAQMRKFLQVRMQSFAQALPAITAFLEDKRITGHKFGNVYSGGSSAFGTEYADATGMVVHCRASYAGIPADVAKYIEKFEGKWRTEITNVYNISISQTRITGNEINFQLYVK